MDDHYFETRFTDADGNEIPPQRYRTLQAAMAEIIGLPDGSIGSIWYQDEPAAEEVEVIRQEADGTMVDVQNDDGTNYPLGQVPDTIEPGALMLSLWLEDPKGERAAYDFGFDWDGDHSARWQCSEAEGPGYCAGAMFWSGDDDDDKDAAGEGNLGDDLKLVYDSSSGAAHKNGETLIKDGKLWNPVSRDQWVSTAEWIFDFLRGEKLI